MSALTEIERHCDNVANIMLSHADEQGKADTDITDLLADLMHYCDQMGHDFSYCLQSAEQHYEEEVSEARELISTGG